MAYEWDLATGTCVQQFEGHTDYLHDISYLPKSNELLTASEDGTVGIWGTMYDLLTIDE